jgi:PadR family transcriptional regulator, regulatory protein PadR
LTNACNVDNNACIADMKPPPYLGEFEYAVLLAVLQVGEHAYAVPVREVIEQRTHRAVARGALYTALERLETKGCLSSKVGDATAERGGRPRRYFAVTAQGLAALRTTHAALRNLATGLESLLERP